MTNDRLFAFGDRLRQLRKARGMTGAGFAASTAASGSTWSPSKVTRLETGQQTASEQDLQMYADLLALTDEEHDDLRRELRAIRLDEARWRTRLRAGGHESAQVSFGELERNARHIRAFDVAFVPGLVQTAAYARLVFSRLTQLKGGVEDPDAATAARMERQSVLYDTSKTFELLMCETALRSSIAPPDILVPQIDRLVSVCGSLPNVRFGVIPIGEALPYPAMHGFWILDDILNVELLHTEVNTRDQDDVQLHHSYLDALWPLAREGDQARRLLLDRGAVLRG